MLTITTKIYIAAGAVLLILFAGSYIISSVQTTRLEKAAADAMEKAAESEAAAEANEHKAAEYKQKLEYLESRIAELGTIARRQDEELEKTYLDTAAARRGVERSRSAGAKPSSAGELCGKLAELGYPCWR